MSKISLFFAQQKVQHKGPENMTFENMPTTDLPLQDGFSDVVFVFQSGDKPLSADSPSPSAHQPISPSASGLNLGNRDDTGLLGGDIRPSQAPDFVGKKLIGYRLI
jgi:hypothetical protein